MQIMQNVSQRDSVEARSSLICRTHPDYCRYYHTPRAGCLAACADFRENRKTTATVFVR